MARKPISPDDKSGKTSNQEGVDLDEAIKELEEEEAHEKEER